MAPCPSLCNENSEKNGTGGLLLQAVLPYSSSAFVGRFISVFFSELFPQAILLFSQTTETSLRCSWAGSAVGFENVSQVSPDLIKRIESKCIFTKKKKSQNHIGNKAEKLLNLF